jgi:hypothetical protein
VAGSDLATRALTEELNRSKLKSARNTKTASQTALKEIAQPLRSRREKGQRIEPSRIALSEYMGTT